MTQNKLKWGYTYFMYKGIPKKGSEDVVSAVCYTIYTIFISLLSQAGYMLFFIVYIVTNS